MTMRELFSVLLSNGPIVRSDAIVVLCGEDAKPRVDVAVELLKQGAAQLVVVSGGKHEPPRILGATECARDLLAAGCKHDRIIVEAESQNTREQAVNVIAIAKERDWKCLTLVCSAYHQYRAFLTFLKALSEAGLSESVRLTIVPCSQSPWFGKPEGSDNTREELLDGEFTKIDLHAEHVASYAEGVEYLKRWEGV